MAAMLFVLSACVSEVDRTVAPTPSPTDTPQPTATPRPTATPTPTPTSTPTPSPTPTIVPISAPPRNVDVLPHVFVGSVTIGGLAAPDGTEVTVWVSQYNGPVGTGTVTAGNYSVLAHQHGTTSFDGEILIFKVNGKESGKTGIWKTGDATILAFSLD